MSCSNCYHLRRLKTIDGYSYCCNVNNKGQNGVVTELKSTEFVCDRWEIRCKPCRCFVWENGVSRCYGTKNKEECHCNGNKDKCDFYKEKRG